MKKRAKVIMLPTNKAENCIIRSQNDDMFYHQGALLTQEYLKSGHGVIGLQSRTSHHLYITTDDEIKKGDWYVLTKNDGNPTIILKATVDGGSLKFNSEKIIATTDPELNKGWIEDLDPERKSTHTQLVTHQGLPKPSKAFIEKYCELGGIDEVDVDYLVTKTFGDTKHLDTEEPKVISNNEIIIHPIKDSWTLDELPDLLNRFCKDHSLHRGLQITDGMIREWIEKQ